PGAHAGGIDGGAAGLWSGPGAGDAGADRGSVEPGAGQGGRLGGRRADHGAAGGVLARRGGRPEGPFFPAGGGPPPRAAPRGPGHGSAGQRRAAAADVRAGVGVAPLHGGRARRRDLTAASEYGEREARGAVVILKPPCPPVDNKVCPVPTRIPGRKEAAGGGL